MSVSLLVSNVKVTGSNIIYNADLTGIGGAQVFSSGNKIFISGGAGGGGGGGGTTSDLNFGFVSPIPSGVERYYIGLQNTLTGPPVIGLTLETEGPNVGYFSAISGRTITGFWALFSDTVTESGLLLNVMVQGTGVANSGLAYVSGVPTGIDQHFFSYPNAYLFGFNPKINITLETEAPNVYYGIAISGRSISGFWSLFSDIVTETGLSLNIIAKS